MTYNPDDLLGVRRTLMNNTGLPAVALGILGDDSHNSSGGYHVGNDTLSLIGNYYDDYSKAESSRDRPGTNAASALDIGYFDTGQTNLRALSIAMVSACQRNDPRMRDVREIIYSPDGYSVRRWDRLGIRSSGDDTHLSHTHISFFRDSEGRRNNSDNFGGFIATFFNPVYGGQYTMWDQILTSSRSGPTSDGNALLSIYDSCLLDINPAVQTTKSNVAAVKAVVDYMKPTLDAVKNSVANLNLSATLTEADRQAIGTIAGNSAANVAAAAVAELKGEVDDIKAKVDQIHQMVDALTSVIDTAGATLANVR